MTHKPDHEDPIPNYRASTRSNGPTVGEKQTSSRAPT